MSLFSMRTAVASGAALALVGAIFFAAPGSAQSTSAAPIVRAVPALAEPAPAPPLVLVSRTRLSPRLEELAFRTPYIDKVTKVRVLTPRGYGSVTSRRWPTLFLLHGCCDTIPGRDDAPAGYAAWTDQGKAEKITAAAPFLVVMPEGETAGWYSDHYGLAGEGGPRFESYHINQLVGWIDNHYRTVGSRQGRAVAGLSMGGFGAMSYAARHPDLFSAAASFSGAVNTSHDLIVPQASHSTAVDALQPADGRAPESTWGPRPTEAIRARMHNPWDLAENLRGMDLTIRTGDGTTPGSASTDVLEAMVHDESLTLHQRLAKLGYSHLYDDYGPGTHTWPFWQRDLAQLVQPLARHFARKQATPKAFSYTSGELDFTAYGYHVRSDRSSLEFTRFAVAGATVSLEGSGVFTLATAPVYRPGRTYQVQAVRNGVKQTSTLRADRRGRLWLMVDMARRSTGQQDRIGSTTTINRVLLTIREQARPTP